MTKFVKTITLGALALGLALPTMSFAADSGADLFKQKCAMCHGEAGAGKGKVSALSSADVQKMSDADFKNAITKGAKTDKGMMPAYGGKLSDDQIDSLVKYVRSVKK